MGLFNRYRRSLAEDARAGQSFWPNPQAVIGWTTLATVCGSSLLLAANRPIGWLLLAGLAAILFACQTIRDALTPGVGQRFLRLFPAALLWLGVLAWALVQAGPAPIESLAHPAWADAGISPGSVSVDPEATLHGVLRLAAYAAIFWIAAEAGRDLKRCIAMLKALAYWQIALGLYGIAAFLAGWNPILGEENTSRVVTASFVGANTYALYAGMGFCCCLTVVLIGLAKNEAADQTIASYVRNLLESILTTGLVAWCGMIILMGAVFYTGSRAGSVAVLFGVLTLLFCVQRQGRLQVVLLLFIALPVTATLLGANSLIEDFSRANLDHELRPEVFERTIQAIATVPWQGVGLGAYQEAFRAFATPEVARLEMDLAHNSYLENSFELGLPAAAAMYLALLWVGGQIWLGIGRRERMRAIPALGIAVMVAGGLHALVDFSLQMPAGAAFFAMILGLAWARSFREASGGRGGSRRRKRRPTGQSA